MLRLGSLAVRVNRPAGAGDRRWRKRPQTQPQPAASNRLRVFLECGDCFETYLRDEIEWVDFLRDPNGADVHIIGTSTSTGGGGQEVALRFVGLGRFQGVNLELKAVSQSGDTDDMRRQGIRRVVTIGLLTYVERAGRGGDIRLRVDPVVAGGGQTTVADDPWKAWVFSLRGSGSLDFEESSRQWEWGASVTADRVTEKWNISFGLSAETSREEFDLDEDEPLSATRRSREFESFFSRALGPHWSLGLVRERVFVIVRQRAIPERNRAGDRVQPLSLRGLRVAPAALHVRDRLTAREVLRSHALRQAGGNQSHSQLRDRHSSRCSRGASCR